MKILQTGRFNWLLLIVVMLSVDLTGLEIAAAAQSYQKQRASNNQMDDAVKMIQQQTGGRVLRVRENDSSYVIKVLMPSGVIKTYRVDNNRRQGASQRYDNRMKREKPSKKERR